MDAVAAEVELGASPLTVPVLQRVNLRSLALLGLLLLS